MKEHLRRIALFILALLPIAAIAFAAKAALSVAQIRKAGVTDFELADADGHSRGS